MLYTNVLSYILMLLVQYKYTYNNTVFVRYNGDNRYGLSGNSKVDTSKFHTQPTKLFWSKDIILVIIIANLIRYYCDYNL